MPPLPPSFSIPSGPFSLSARAPTSSNSTIDDRPAISLAYSCLFVIFLATYSSVHPNVPRTQRDKEQEAPVKFVKQPHKWIWRRAVDFVGGPKLSLLLVALVAPELIFGMAFRQWSNVGYLKKAYGFHERVAWMLVIGGIVTAAGEPLVSASWSELEPYLDQLYAQHAVDVDDKSKATVLSKAILLFQLCWFVVQITQRLVSGLPLTELESVTLAFTAVQLCTGYFWMKKPKDVGEPIWLVSVEMVDKNKNAEVEAESPKGKVPDREVDSPVVQSVPLRRVDSAETLIGSDPPEVDSDSDSDTTHVSESDLVTSSTKATSSSPKSSIGHVLTAIIFGTYPRKEWVSTIRQDGRVPIFWPGPWFPKPKSDSAVRPEDHRHPSKHEDPIEQALRTGKRHEESTNSAALGLQLLLSISFGLVHCSALLPRFDVEIPTATEWSMWRICAGLILILPFLALVLCILAALLRKGTPKSIVVSMNRVVALVYFSARLFLLVLPFVALRTHPALGPDWKASIPHF